MVDTNTLADEVQDRFAGLPTSVDLEKVKEYGKAYAEYILSRVADDLDRTSNFSSARALRDKIDKLREG